MQPSLGFATEEPEPDQCCAGKGWLLFDPTAHRRDLRRAARAKSQNSTRNCPEAGVSERRYRGQRPEPG